MTIILVYIHVHVPCTLLKPEYSLAIFPALPTADTSVASTLTSRAATIFHSR